MVEPVTYCGRHVPLACIAEPLVKTNAFILKAWKGWWWPADTKCALVILINIVGRILLIVPFILANLGLALLVLGGCCRRPAPEAIPEKKIGANVKEIEELVDRVFSICCTSRFGSYVALAILRFPPSKEATAEEGEHAILEITVLKDNVKKVKVLVQQGTEVIDSTVVDLPANKKVLLQLIADQFKDKVTYDSMRVDILKPIVAEDKFEIFSYTKARKLKKGHHNLLTFIKDNPLIGTNLSRSDITTSTAKVVSQFSPYLGRLQTYGV